MTGWAPGVIIFLVGAWGADTGGTEMKSRYYVRFRLLKDKDFVQYGCLDGGHWTVSENADNAHEFATRAEAEAVLKNGYGGIAEYGEVVALEG